MASASVLSSRGSSDEGELRAALRGDLPGPVNAESLRRALRRARDAAEAERKAATVAWREQPQLFTPEVEERARVRGLPSWAAAEARRTAELTAEIEDLIRLCETYDAQVVVALFENRALARKSLLAILERLETSAGLLRARLPQLRTARATLDALPVQREGWDVPGKSSPDAGRISVARPSTAELEASNGEKHCSPLPLVVIQNAEPPACPGWLRSLAASLQGIGFETLDLSMDFAEALARFSGLLPTEALGEACAPWDPIVKPPSLWLAIPEIIATAAVRCQLGLGRCGPASLGWLLGVPQLRTGYWKIRGLGAPMRMMCAYAGVVCEDVQYEARMTSTGGWASAEWEERDRPALVEKNVFTQLPYVENLTTGEVVTQFSSVSLYLGRVLGLNGPTRRSQALNEQVLGHVHTMWMELRELVYPSRQSPDRAAFKASLAAHFDNTLTKHYEKLECWLQQRGTGYFVSWKPCTADFHVWEMLDQQDEMAKSTGFTSPMMHFDLLRDFHTAIKRLWRLRLYFESNDAILPINNKNAHFR